MNIYPAGQCTWWCADQQPWCLRHGNLGNAKWWGSAWRQFGELTTLIPEVGSIVCFQPGVQGASDLGHVAVVIAVAAGEFTVSEMNGPDGPGHTDDRVCKLVDGESFLMPLSVPAPETDVKPILATTHRSSTTTPDPHGAGAVYLVNDWPFGPKRWITKPAYLAPYVPICGPVQVVNPFVLDRIEEGPHIDAVASPPEA